MEGHRSATLLQFWFANIMTKRSQRNQESSNKVEGGLSRERIVQDYVKYVAGEREGLHVYPTDNLLITQATYIVQRGTKILSPGKKGMIRLTNSIN